MSISIPLILNGAFVSKFERDDGLVHNDDGHKCIANMICEADTLEPGVTPLKWKLSIPQAAATNICQ